jgi:SAM-dependent methyltransferase
VGFIGAREAFLHNAIRAAYPDRIIVGLDVNEQRLRHLALPRTVAGDGFFLPFREGSFACVVLAEVLEHVRNPFALLCEMARVLREAGTLIITTPNPYHTVRWLKHWLFARDLVGAKNVRGFLGHPEHQMLLEPLSLLSLLSHCGLRPTEVTTQKFTVPFLGRFLRPRVFDLPLYPFNRLGGYVLVLAVKEPKTIRTRPGRTSG